MEARVVNTKMKLFILLRDNVQGTTKGRYSSLPKISGRALAPNIGAGELVPVVSAMLGIHGVKGRLD